MAFAEDRYTTGEGRNLTFKFYSHASIRIDYDDALIYVDPVSEYADYAKEKKADIILITHDHYDHLDLKAVEDLLQTNTRIIANADTVAKIDFSNAEILEYGRQTEVDNIKIKAFEAYNTTLGRDKFHPRGRDNGYLLTIGDKRIYISGDTETIEDSEEINGCDFLFLAVNQPYTMTVDQAKKFVQRIQPKIFYPYHTTDTDMTALQKAISPLGIRMIIHDMQ